LKKQTNNSLTTYLLEQALFPHARVCSTSPLHQAPPCCGDGLAHVRVLFWDPPSHATEQACHSDHVVQPPSTEKQHHHKCITNNSNDRTYNYVFISFTQHHKFVVHRRNLRLFVSRTGVAEFINTN
jgi:hypothetical protein